VRPFFLIVSERSGDITGKLIDRVVRLSVVDAEGIENDSLEVEIDDRGQFIALPETGEYLRVYLGYQGGPIVEMGRYVVDELTLSGPPLTIGFTAKGADMTKPLRAPKTLTRHAEGLTLGQLAREIAQTHGLEPRIHPEVEPIPVEHVDQMGESDMALLGRLADLHDLSLRLTADELILRPHPARLAPEDPLRPPPVVLDARYITRYRWQRQSRTEYADTRATYYDADTGRREAVYAVGRGNGAPQTGDASTKPVLELRHDARDRDGAERLAKARHGQNARACASLSLDLPGDPYLQAGAHLTLTGLSEPVGGEWTVERVTHRVDARGYSMAVEAVPPGQDQDTEGATP
jgi:uncharacterized protein